MTEDQRERMRDRQSEREDIAACEGVIKVLFTVKILIMKEHYVTLRPHCEG